MTRRLCLVTGASAGIGAAFARIYASHGYDVALTARRVDRLEALAGEIRLRHGVECLIIPEDLAQTGAVDRVLAQIEDHGRWVDALVNNAGYGLPERYVDSAWSDQQAFLQVLLVAACEVAHKVSPGMTQRGFGRIINVASLAGLVPGTAGATLYGATKAFLVRFSQSLHLEARDRGVHVSALCPGFTHSEFHDVNHTREQLDLPAWMWLSAEHVATAGYEAVEANRTICVPGAVNKTIAVLAKLIPDDWALTLMAHQQRRFRRG